MLIKIQFKKSCFQLMSSAVQSFLNVPIAKFVSICERIKAPDMGCRMTKGFFTSGGSFELYINVIDQSHSYGRPQAACREPAGSFDKTTRTAICFELKTQYLLIRAHYTRIVVFWHISNIPPVISQSQISCNTPTFYIAAIFVKYCYTTGSWLL